MKNKLTGLMLICITIFLISSCVTYPINPYSSSAENVMHLRKINTSGNKLNIGTFTSIEQGITGFKCRMDGPSKIPDNMTVEQYIEKAFKDDLTLADIYSPNSKYILTGKIINADVRSPVGEGKWTFKVAYSINDREVFTIDSYYKFPSAFPAGLACKDTATAFVPAVRKLIMQTCDHPEFKKLLRK